MDRTLRQVVLATVAVLVIAVAAATLPNPVATGPGGPTPVDEDPGGGDVDLGFGGEGVSFGLGGGNVGFRALCVPFLLSPYFIWGAILALLGAGYLIYRRTDIVAVIGAYGLILTPGILIYLLLTDCRSVPETPEQQRSPLPEYNISFLFEGGTGSGGTAGGAIPTASPTFVLLIGVILLVVLVLFLRTTGDDGLVGDPEPEEPVADEPALAAVGAAAGRAADRIEGQASVENEVFRAWREMTDRLDLDRPETITPGEFAERAIEAGMDRTHVEELTGLFRSVRYGGDAPTPEREQRAIETLRAIESAYGDEIEATEPDDSNAAPDSEGSDADP